MIDFCWLVTLSRTSWVISVTCIVEESSSSPVVTTDEEWERGREGERDKGKKRMREGGRGVEDQRERRGEEKLSRVYKCFNTTFFNVHNYACTSYQYMYDSPVIYSLYFRPSSLICSGWKTAGWLFPTWPKGPVWCSLILNPRLGLSNKTMGVSEATPGRVKSSARRQRTQWNP